MKRICARRQLLLAASAAFAIFHNLVDVAHAANGIKEFFDNTVGRIRKYAWESSTIEYVNPEDFEPAENILRVVDIYPGQALTYGCGKAGSNAMGQFMMLPTNPNTHVLLAKGDDSIEVASKRVVPKHSVYRSDRDLIVTTFQNIGLDHILIDYNSDAIVMAKDHEHFSINLLCIYIPADVDGEVKYRWLQINFKNVLPMGYGCGSGGYNMFKNALALNENTLERKIIDASKCDIRAEPNMVLGIYCDKNDHVYPDDCFHRVSKNGGTTVEFNDIRDISFPHNINVGRLRLMKLGTSLDNIDTAFECQCRNKENKITSVMKVSIRKTETCNFVKILEMQNKFDKCLSDVCQKILTNNTTIRFIVPKSDGVKDLSVKNGGLMFYPINFTQYTYVPKANSEDFKKVRVNRLIGSSGLRFNMIEEGNIIKYEIIAAKDAIIVLKQSIASLSYFYEHYTNQYGSSSETTTIISIAVVPTDPYTHGCGAYNKDIFNKSGVVTTNTQVKMGAHFYTEVKCRVNAWESSPIGFHCPKDHILEPADCFNSAFLLSTNKVVRIEKYVPFARVLDSPNIRVVDFTAPKTMDMYKKYSSESLQCRCRRKNGDLVATITVDLNEPIPSI
ncbi:hypothetical protein BaOVIS_023530 [Babesia ovis]|uniref:6-Cys domain-containing protein n=1 Tax=Babesia ovis TaxID=5869 RepID=A0A9W5TB44_BABOV|nr:hypothetical protein BaOVIS_023530 [Babesia ovis]